jgi:hypothetical protein
MDSTHPKTEFLASERAEAVRVALARSTDRIGQRQPSDKSPVEFARELLEAVYGVRGEERGL